jgi:hypothetical protein
MRQGEVLGVVGDTPPIRRSSNNLWRMDHLTGLASSFPWEVTCEAPSPNVKKSAEELQLLPIS